MPYYRIQGPKGPRFKEKITFSFPKIHHNFRGEGEEA
jgi:hypothetical protein